ncbi:MAG: DNA adenine methylase, partial [Treponemataceae bacterium]|nr:DNA adenine methylase [Treponemataceae bacterium]
MTLANSADRISVIIVEFRQSMQFDTPYLTKQIIAYIGNKRRLLSLIYAALEQSGITIGAGATFADLFSGSGVVSRFAKSLGFAVYANDWEPYAETLSRGFVALDKSEWQTLFNGAEHFQALIDHINALPDPPDDDQYMVKVLPSSGPRRVWAWGVAGWWLK